MALAIVLVVAWGAGFLWFRGHDAGDAPTAVSATATPTPTASQSSSAPVASAPVSSAPVSSAPVSSAPASSAPVPSSSAAEPAAAKPSAPASSSAPLKRTVTPLGLRMPVDANPAAPRPLPRPLPPVADFTMASFNILGSTHTGKSGANAGMAPGAQRVNGVLSVLAQHDISVVGIQEFQPNQRAAFNARARGWSMWPGLSMGRRAGENSVAWRDDTWERVATDLIPIPYFHGRIRPMPYVLLRHRETGIRAYFSTFHNPASVYGPAQKWRSIATTRQIGLFNRLEQSGVPQLVTGDMNERAEYFCRVTRSTRLKAAAGGSTGPRCAPPRPTQIDWIFGSPDVRFSNYLVDRSPTVRRTTDHPVIVSRVSLDALKYPKSYVPPAG